MLVRRHTALAHRTAYLLGAGSDAEDVVQEAFVKAYQALGGFRVDAPFRPWLLRIVANETRNAHRGRARRHAREALALTAPSEVADPGADAERRIQAQALLRAVELLPEPQRQVVVARYLLDLDEAEAAAVLSLPRGTVKSRLSRGLRTLRRTLGEDAAETGVQR